MATYLLQETEDYLLQEDTGKIILEGVFHVEALSPLRFYLCPQPPETIFTGRVNGAPSDPYINISFDNGAVGAFGNPLPGMTVYFGSTSGGSERGKRRLRSFSGGASGTIKIDESDDVGPLIQNNDYITIRWDFRLWPKYPRFVQNATNVTIYEDYDVAFNSQTNSWWPLAVAGPPGFALLEAGQAQISFVGDRSKALAAGATLTNYLWTAYGSGEGTSASQGTEGSPVVFTWTAPGWYLVSLQVTDSNGNTHTAYTWAIIENPDNPSVTISDFDTISDSFDFEQGGGECGFRVENNASIDDFPEECLVVHVADGTQTTPAGSWPFRTNIMFVGYVLADTVRQNPDNGEVSFRAGTIDAIMRNLSMFAVSLTDKTTATDWTQGKGLTVDRCTSYLAKWRSTLDMMTPIVLTDDTRYIKRQDFGPTDLYSMLQNELVSSILGKVVSTHQGVLYLVIDYNVQNATERATATTRKVLHKGIWTGDVNIEERADYAWVARQVKMSGIYYPGGESDDICPIFSEAPGDAPKSYGKEANFDRLILSGQTDLNVRCGHMLAKLNKRYDPYRLTFLNDGSFTIAPQELFPTIIESGDNERELSFSGNLIPRRMSRTYDHALGYYRAEVDFEPESSGAPGVTVDIPCGPPEQELPHNPDPPDGGSPGETALIASTTGTSFYFALGVETTWERRVNGLVDPDQLGMLDTRPDPWSAFKQGYQPNKVICWGVGLGFLVRSEDSGQNWKDRTSYLTAPTWPGESTSIENISFIRFDTSLFAEDQHFLLARWQTGGSWRGAVGKSTDGFNFDWYYLTGSSQVKPLGMSVDRGNGTLLWITTWQSDNTLYLNKLSVADMSLTNSYSMGGATEAQIDAKTYYATPFNRVGQANEVFIFGRMDDPQSLTGTVVHVLVTDDGGGSYDVVENSWADDLCGSFAADTEGFYYAVRNG